MNCIKHLGNKIPCGICMIEEYNLYKDTPGHDMTDLKAALVQRGLITIE